MYSKFMGVELGKQNRAIKFYNIYQTISGVSNQIFNLKQQLFKNSNLYNINYWILLIIIIKIILLTLY